MDKQFTVEGNLSHDNHQYKTGDPIVLNETEAAPLLAIGRIKLPAPPAPTEPAAPQQPPIQPPQMPPVEPPQVTPPAVPPQGGPGPQQPPTPPAPTEPVTGQPTPEDIANSVAGL
jgi:hypothetical protein